jgi:hypothetical protein
MRVVGYIRIGLFVVALLVAAFSGKVLVDEYRAFRNTHASGDDAFLRLRQDEHLSFSPWAIRTQMGVMEMCNEALIAPISSVVSVDVYRRIAGQCLGYASDITETVPVWGLGQFSIARASFSLGDIEKAHDALMLSARLSPREGWIARKRILLALDPQWIVPPATLDQDLALVLMERSGQKWVAQIFTSVPESQEIILSVAETLPGALQRSFLTQLRLAQQGGA